jgi:hypothetical protein
MSILINENAPRVHYAATSGQKHFVVPFEWFSNGDLKVFVNEQPMFFSEPPLDASQYSTTGEGVTGGGAIDFGPPGRQGGDEVIIVRDMPIARTSDLPTTGAFPIAALNDTFDAQTAMIQQTEVNVEKRTLRMSEADFVEVLNPIPNRDNRAGRFLAFDNAGQPIMVAASGELGPGSGAAALLGRIWTDDDPPPLPWVDGMMWWKSNSGQLFVFYEDADSGQWVQINFMTGTVAPGPELPPGSQIDIHFETVLLTAPSGSWVKPLDCRYYRIRAAGGGGGGGGARNSPTTPIAAGGGGGSGGYGESFWFNASGISGASYACGLKGQGAQGNGGGTSGNVAGSSGHATTWNDGVRSFNFGGGGLGSSHGGNNSFFIRDGGIGGTVTATAGMLALSTAGHGEMSISSPGMISAGAGGSNPLGRGGTRFVAYTGATIVSAAGDDPTSGFGGGGGGAGRLSATNGANTGGDGAAGCILVDMLF